jgi:Fe-S cluster biosynthesis and repair protein YggX
MQQITIEDAIKSTTKSRLFNHIRNFEGSKFVKFTRPRTIDGLALFKSQNFMYELQTKPHWSQYASQFTMSEINEFKIEVKNYATTQFTPSLNEMHKDFFRRKFNHIRGYLDPKLVFNNFQEYGINKGMWGVNEAKLYELGLDYYMKDLNFEILSNLKRLPVNQEFYDYFKEDQTRRWPEFLKLFPYLKTLNLSASSGSPHWNEQNIGYILDNTATSYDNLVKQVEMYVTAYCRTQGGATIEEIVNELIKKLGELIGWKNRFVAGVPYDVKDTQSIITYLFQQSKPKWTPYFKTGVEVNTRVMKGIEVANAKGYYYYASDIQSCDQSHTNPNLDRLFMKFKNRLEELDVMLNWLVKYFVAGYKFLKNPKILWNMRHLQHNNYPGGRTFSLSGHPHIPIFQTLSVLVAHVIASLHALGRLKDVQGEKLEDKIKDEVIDVLCQIDDIFMIIDLNGKDPEEFKRNISDFMFKHYGLRTNHSKFVDSVLGFTILLKVVIGFLFPGEEGLLALDGTHDVLTFIGYIPTKTQGMFDKERGAKDDGTPILYLELDDLDSKDQKKLVNVNHKYIDPDTGDVLYGAKKALQQLYGSLQSFGPKMPVSLLKLIQWHFHKKQVWDELILLSKIKTKRILTRDWGFQDHELVLKSVANLGEPHQWRD